MTLPPIQSFWIGRPLSTIERLAIRSFLANGHEFHLYIYDEPENVPEGTTFRNAEEILPRSAIFQPKDGFWAGSHAPFADIFRLELLCQRGGWWVDLDTICLRPFDMQKTNVIAASTEWKWGEVGNINVLRFEPGDRVALRILEILRERRPEFKSPGPNAVQLAVKELSAQDYLAPGVLFNPISWRYVKYILHPQEPFWHPRRLKRTLGMTPPVGRITPESYSLHLWNETWRQNNFDREGTYHPDGLFEQLKRKYL